jgi:hypothetical protein
MMRRITRAVERIIQTSSHEEAGNLRKTVAAVSGHRSHEAFAGEIAILRAS